MFSLRLSNKEKSKKIGEDHFMIRFVHNRIFYVYILLCADESYYIGVTNNLVRRLKEHESGAKELSYTACRLPVRLLFYETFKHPMVAIRREKQLKGWSRQKKEALMENNIKKLKELSKCNNDSHYRNYVEDKLNDIIMLRLRSA